MKAFQLLYSVIALSLSTILVTLCIACGDDDDSDDSSTGDQGEVKTACETAPDFLAVYCGKYADCFSQTANECCEDMVDDEHYGAVKACGEETRNAYQVLIACYNQESSCEALTDTATCENETNEYASLYSACQ